MFGKFNHAMVDKFRVNILLRLDFL